MVKLSVVILSYNTKDITRQCLEFLLKTVADNKPLSVEIIVIDNGSTDGSVEMIKTFPEIRTVFNKKNLGYPKGNNQGLKSASGQYVLFLNSDVMFGQMDLKKVIGYLDQNKNIGVLTVKVVLPTGKIDPASHRGFPTLWRSSSYFFKLEKLFGRIPLLNRLFGGYHLTYLDLKKIHEIDSSSGAFYLCRTELIKKLKGFDEDYFMYGEDLDLSYRIKKLGYQVVYYPFFRVTHLKYASGLNKDGEERKKTKEYFYESMKIFYKKHYQNKYPEIVNRLVYFIIGLKTKYL